jgi:hypothetical protein
VNSERIPSLAPEENSNEHKARWQISILQIFSTGPKRLGNPTLEEEEEEEEGSLS